MLGLIAALGFGCARQEEPANFVLITLDTTRPDHLGPYGYAAARTPNLDRFALGAEVYERAYATSSWTLASHASILTGLLPRQHGAQSMPKGPDRSLGYGVRPLSDSFLTLAEILAGTGYRTGAVVAGPALRSELGTAQGFEFYEDDLKGAEKRVHGKRAEETTDLALDLIQTFGDEPFFLFVNYFDAHAPYAPPEGFPDSFLEGSRESEAEPEEEAGPPLEPPLIVRYIQRLNAGVPAQKPEAMPGEERAELRRALAGYDAEIAYLDFHLGRLLRAIEASPGAENTWVIITGDHGESFGEHYFVSHGAHLYEDNVRVPLLIRRPGRAAPRRVHGPVQNHALFGAILDAAGVARRGWARPLPGDNEKGGSAEKGERADKREIVLEVHRSDSNIGIGGEFFDRDPIALLVPSFKLIRSSRGEDDFFDLEADPQELDNQLTRNPELAARLTALEAERTPLYPESAPLELRLWYSLESFGGNQWMPLSDAGNRGGPARHGVYRVVRAGCAGWVPGGREARCASPPRTSLPCPMEGSPG